MRLSLRLSETASVDFSEDSGNLIKTVVLQLNLKL